MASQTKVKMGEAFVEITGDDNKLKIATANAAKSLRKLGHTFRQVGLGMAKVGAMILAPFALATKVFASFDDQMRATQGVLNATGEDFTMLTEKAKELGRTTSFTAQQVASAMTELARAGFDPQQIDAAIASVLNLSRATGTDLAEAATITGNTLRVFGLEAAEATRVADVLTATANNSAQTLTEMAEAMKFAGPVADAFGLSLEQTSKALGALANFGIKGSIAGNTLKNVMLQLTKPEIQNAVKNLVPDADFADVGKLLGQLGTAIKDMPKLKQLGILNELFGRRAVAGGIKLTTANFEKLNDAIDNAEGTAKKTAETMDKGIGGALRRLWSAVEGTAIAIGDALAPAVSAIADILAGAAKWIAEFADNNKWLVQTIGAIGVALLTTGLLLIGLGKAISIISLVMLKWGSIIGGLIKAAGLLKIAFLWMMAHPLILALAGIVAAVYLITKALRKQADAVEALTKKYEKLREEARKQREEAEKADEDVARRIEKTIDKIASAEFKLAEIRRKASEENLSAKEKEIKAAQNAIDAELLLIRTIKTQAAERKKLEAEKKFTEFDVKAIKAQEALLETIQNAEVGLGSEAHSAQTRSNMRAQIEWWKRRGSALQKQRNQAKKVKDETIAAAEVELEQMKGIESQKVEIEKRGAEKIAQIRAKHAEIERKRQNEETARRATESTKAAVDRAKAAARAGETVEQASLRLRFEQWQRQLDAIISGKIKGSKLEDPEAIIERAKKNKGITFEQYVKTVTEASDKAGGAMTGTAGLSGGFLASRFTQAGANVDIQTQTKIEKNTRMTAENTERIAMQEGIVVA